MPTRVLLLLLLSCVCFTGAPRPSVAEEARHPEAPTFDVLIRGGTVYDGTGAPGRREDVGIRGDRVAAIGDLTAATAGRTIDARGLAVAPGFINVLSWANESLLVDGRSQSDVRQGVTLEIMGEGWSMGPYTPAMKEEILRLQGALKFPVEWTTLGEYLQLLERRGVSTNVASFVGATTVRINAMGYAMRPPTPDEMRRMQDLVREAMREGALGVGSSLIYAPAVYASTAELKALALAAAEYGGSYATHMRSEARHLLEGIDEAIEIATATRQHVEIYHLKAAGEQHWPKIDAAIAKIEAARGKGVKIAANMYPYVAGAAGLDAALPSWALEGGIEAAIVRLRDPAYRARVLAAMRSYDGSWESLYALSGSPDRVRLLAFRTEALRPLIGKTIAEVAAMRGRSPEDTVLDLIIEDGSIVGVAYFMMSETNVERQLRLPWISLGSDEASLAPEGVFLQQAPHPRAYGSFARFLGYYVRERGVATLPDAIRRLTSLPATQLKLEGRGTLAVGSYADVAIFDPATIRDHATYDEPQRYSTGVRHVLVNGVPVLLDGEHTGAKPGRFVRGPGHRPR